MRPQESAFVRPAAPRVFGSVRARLALWNTLVLALALIGAGALVQRRVASDLAASMDNDLQGVGQFMERRWWHPTRRDREGPPPPPPSPSPSPSVNAAESREAGREGGNARDREKDKENDPLRPRFLSQDGSSYRSHTPDAAYDMAALRRVFVENKPLYSTIENSKVGEPLRVYTLPLHDDAKDAKKVEAAIQVVRPLTNLRATVDQLTRTLLALLPVALAFAGAGALFLTDRALRPVRAVTRAAARIEAENLSDRLTVSGDDEMARLAEQFNGMLNRLQKAFEEREASYERQRRFVADASHELRTPLTIIKANTSLTLADPDLTPEYREVLEEVDHAATRTVRIARDLLLLTRSDSGQLIIEPVETPASDLLRQAAREAAALHPGGATVTVEGSENLTVWGDRHHLSRLLLNLADNALRHTPANGTVTLCAASQSDGGIRLTVRDTGEGIAPEHLPLVRDRFYRVDASRDRESGGTGLGLAICEAIAAAHGGTLTVESAGTGQGTTVNVTLPPEPSTAMT